MLQKLARTCNVIHIIFYYGSQSRRAARGATQLWENVGFLMNTLHDRNCNHGHCSEFDGRFRE